ncbi:hypothetical protein AAG570_013471 [Ranatra chinensis]|uniref:Uncharacterized protein n=1 Tax=Ranatra chinensis TaxID=642074 RepID=A0ABD0YNW6_9HEMI
MVGDTEEPGRYGPNCNRSTATMFGGGSADDNKERAHFEHLQAETQGGWAGKAVSGRRKVTFHGSETGPSTYGDQEVCPRHEGEWGNRSAPLACGVSNADPGEDCIVEHVEYTCGTRAGGVSLPVGGAPLIGHSWAPGGKHHLCTQPATPCVTHPYNPLLGLKDTEERRTGSQVLVVQIGSIRDEPLSLACILQAMFVDRAIPRPAAGKLKRKIEFFRGGRNSNYRHQVVLAHGGY